jgi:hypothetical protein
MKTGHRILYHCGEESSHRLLLVKEGGALDSFRSYVYSEATGDTLYRSPRTDGPAEVERWAQLAALRAGVSPVLHSKGSITA